MPRVKGTSYYTNVDLPESGTVTVLIAIAEKAAGGYLVSWSRGLDGHHPLSAKDTLAMIDLVAKSARWRLQHMGYRGTVHVIT